MSFVGCIGTLMTNTGLSDLLQSAFGGVDRMLQGKNFPQNTHALRICAEEVLRVTLQDDSVGDFRSLMDKLDSIASKSRTAHLWLDALIWPVFLIMSLLGLAGKQTGLFILTF